MTTSEFYDQQMDEYQKMFKQAITVEQYAASLGGIDEQTDEMCLAAVKQNEWRCDDWENVPVIEWCDFPPKPEKRR